MTSTRHKQYYIVVFVPVFDATNVTSTAGQSGDFFETKIDGAATVRRLVARWEIVKSELFVHFI